ncbi:MAG: hypothetical protein HC903_11125 [Methylacidiphilales bacterium]|nr:hypothetical protein [Candidatus Methylacidiphilales bacterium]NJR17127.1 hypothetical protein [Calothrix sp. CSU_2_0]
MNKPNMEGLKRMAASNGLPTKMTNNQLQPDRILCEIREKLLELKADKVYWQSVNLLLRESTDLSLLDALRTIENALEMGDA